MQKDNEALVPQPQTPEPEPPLDSPFGPMLWLLIPFVLILIAGTCMP